MTLLSRIPPTLPAAFAARLADGYRQAQVSTDDHIWMVALKPSGDLLIGREPLHLQARCGQTQTVALGDAGELGVVVERWRRRV